jgi:hypothetical protein
MQEPIELSGEANPLTLQNLFNALASAGSSNQQQLQIGSQQLQNWEKHEQYFSLLQVNSLSHSLLYAPTFNSICFCFISPGSV